MIKNAETVFQDATDKELNAIDKIKKYLGVRIQAL
jgi:hypothetical protein